jgi:hypothetical protein
MEQHTQVKSRQCKGLKDPEGTQPAVETCKTPSCEATFTGEVSRGIKFDDPGPDVLGQGRMEEAHSSRTR